MGPPKAHRQRQQPQSLQNTNTSHTGAMAINIDTSRPTPAKKPVSTIPGQAISVDDTPAKKRKLIDSKEEPNPNLVFPYTDGASEVENQILYVAKSILSKASPVFKKMFESEFKEKDMKAIKLPGKKVEDVALFLKCIYPFIEQPVTVETVMQILPLAHEYMAKDVLSECINIILKHCNENIEFLKSMRTQTISLNQLLTYLVACEKFSLQENLLGTLVELASFMEFSTMKNLEGFKCLSEATQILILSKRLEGFERTYKNPPSLTSVNIYRTHNVSNVSDVSAFNSFFRFKKQV